MARKDTVMLNGNRHIVMECGNCGVWHTVPEVKYDSCYREGGFWTCPNGHSRGWDKGADQTEMENLRRERDRLKQDAARAADELTAERKRADEAEKKVLQTKRRANAGVCQCCNRTFQNVQRHMKTKHPNVIPLECKAV